MTLVVCLEGKDGLVLAADSRGTIGDPRGLTAISDSHTKLFQLSKFTGIVSFGTAEIAAQSITAIKDNLGSDDIYFSSVFDKARETIRTKYTEWFRNLPLERRPVLGFIIAGLEEDKKAKMYYLQNRFDFAPQLCTTGIALGGIPQYATYLVHRLYDPKMSIKNLITLAAYVISETATQDPKVGGPVRIAQISSDEGYHQLDQSQVKGVVERNEKLNKQLRNFFFPREE